MRGIVDKELRVLSYMSRFDHPAGNIIGDDAILFREALKQLEYPKTLVLIIHSPGGVIEAAEKIGLMLRQTTKNLLVIVPDSAKSAATMLALMSNQILMSDLSELGPIDPQIPIGREPNTGAAIFRPAWSIIKAPNRLEGMLKGGLNAALVGVLAKSLDPTLFDVAQNALDLSATIAENWLSKYMGVDAKDAGSIAKYLGNHEKFVSHGRSIGLAEIQSIGVKAVKMDATLEEMAFELLLRSRMVLRERRMKIVDWDSSGLVADM